MSERVHGAQTSTGNCFHKRGVLKLNTFLQFYFWTLQEPQVPWTPDSEVLLDFSTGLSLKLPVHESLVWLHTWDTYNLPLLKTDQANPGHRVTGNSFTFE